MQKKLNMLCMYHDKKLIDTNYFEFTNIQCGRENNIPRLEMLGDDTGQNISSRNPYWSEITGLYWAWKHISYTKYVGLCSYRRFFNYNFNTYKPIEIVDISAGQIIFNKCEIQFDEEYFHENDIITPIPYIYPRSIRESWALNFRIKDLKILDEIVYNKYPDYWIAYSSYLDGNMIIGHNMFIMRWDAFQKYCEWVFSILMAAEVEIDASTYPVNQKRVFGYMHEILLGVFIKHNKLRTIHSQVVWINPDVKKSYFNNIFYQFAAVMTFYIKKIFNLN